MSWHSIHKRLNLQLKSGQYSLTRKRHRQRFYSFFLPSSIDFQQVNHIINEFYVKQVISDRNQFSPMIPAPLARGKYMTLLLR